ncbi:serine/threonine-protein kinase C-like [Ischnura elegans]|uniref:serine/threonine-protein kinase C-like n=1 Tax=Ischnura elegans TaxID=197161 RepID=UPI001ED86CDE|nr:serine/threonine-protein kinase C-like [Ischnura elegans]
MAAGGYPRTASQVRDKLNNLRKRYLELKRSLRSGDSPPEWRHWEALHMLYSSSPAGTPEALVDSLVSSEVATNEEGTGSPRMTSGTSARGMRKRRRRDPAEALWATREDIRAALARMEEREERALVCLEQTAEAVRRGSFVVPHPYPSPPISLPPSSPSVSMPLPSPSVSMPLPSPSVSMPLPSPSVSMPLPSPSVSMPLPSPSVSMPLPSPSVSMPLPSRSVSLLTNPQPSTSQPSSRLSPQNLL